jgi:hypothetical protein
MFLIPWKWVRVAADLAPLVVDLVKAYAGKDKQEVKKHLALAAIEAKRLPEKELRGG